MGLTTWQLSDRIVDFTSLRLPSGTAVVWSWAFDNDTVALTVIGPRILDGMTWPDA